MMQRLRDILHEIRIWWAMHCALSATDFHVARKLWRLHARLVAMRIPQQVRRMEQRMGLV